MDLSKDEKEILGRWLDDLQYLLKTYAKCLGKTEDAILSSYGIYFTQ